MSNLYAERDIIEQGDHYSRHISAMTCEGLHSKSAIAAELAHRDIQLEQAESLMAKLSEALQVAVDTPELQGGTWYDMAVSALRSEVSDAWLLRKQAEAVEQCVKANKTIYLTDYAGRMIGHCNDYAQHLRQQADEAERAGGEK